MIWAAQTFTIDENRIAGTEVGTIEVTDSDGDALTFAILSGNYGNEQVPANQLIRKMMI